MRLPRGEGCLEGGVGGTSRSRLLATEAGRHVLGTHRIEELERVDDSRARCAIADAPHAADTRYVDGTRYADDTHMARRERNRALDAHGRFLRHGGRRWIMEGQAERDGRYTCDWWGLRGRRRRRRRRSNFDKRRRRRRDRPTRDIGGRIRLRGRWMRRIAVV